MSQTETVKLQLTRQNAIEKAAEAVDGEVGSKTKVKFFSSTEVGIPVYLPGFAYPLVITAEGDLKMDLYHERWGSQKVVDRFIQAYGVAAVKEIAKEQNWGVISQATLEDGSVKIMLDGGSEREDIAHIDGGGAPTL